MAHSTREVLIPEVMCSERAPEPECDHICEFLPGWMRGGHTMMQDGHLVHRCRRCGQPWISTNG